jgi:glucose-6-phosphate 1-dehydrogenase
MTYTPGMMTVGIDPQVFVIFGGTGDLAHRKLLPALYDMLKTRHFDDVVEVLAVATGSMTDDEYRASVAASLAEAGCIGADEWAEEYLHFQSIDEGFERLSARILALEKASGLPGNRAFYLAIPPSVFDDAIEGLGKHGLVSGPGWVRIVVEKPFGSDAASAAHLNAVLHSWFDESQVYRIDHYLAKETVQNLMALRFANPLFERSWNRDGVDSVQITVAEDIGIGERAGYYETAGAIRDIVQNHVLQLISLVAMEPPVRNDAESIRNEKVKVLQAMYPIDLHDYVRGQYGEGTVAGEQVVAYRDEDGVSPNSETETFAALRLFVDNWRWKDVPFYIRVGKRMTERATQISMVFKEPPVCLFEDSGRRTMHPNAFDIRLQPKEGFELGFELKVPGEGYNLQTQRLHFHYDEAFGALPPAYVTLLADVMTGDQTLFVRADEVEEAWRIVAPALSTNLPDPDPYPSGSWGPPSATELLARTGRTWQPLEPPH